MRYDRGFISLNLEKKWIRLRFYSIENREIRYIWRFSLLKIVKTCKASEDEPISDEEEHKH